MTAAPLRFETLIERHHDEIFGYLWRLLDGAGRHDYAVDAEDLTQEVFMRAYRAFERLRPGSNYRAWLYKIATNCAYTALKRARRQARHTTPPGDEIHHIPEGGPSHDDRVIVKESVALVRQAIDALPTRQRAAVIMRHIQGLDYAEIAAAMDCSEDSARANVYQAIRRLRRDLAHNDRSHAVERPRPHSTG
jgi:RNA polymerase sigma-70 factor (ECF subfamily)